MTVSVRAVVVDDPSPRAAWYAIVATATVIAATWFLTDRSPASLAISAVAVAGAGLAAWLVPRSPGAAFGVMLLLAAASGTTLELPPGTMRLEHPAILAVAIRVLLERPAYVYGRVRPVMWIAVAAIAYVLVLALSSALLPPAPMKSLLVAMWTALSILAGGLGYVLLAREPERGTRWLIVAGLATAVVGVLIGLLFWLFGPEWNFGVHGASGPLPKVTAFAWEPNLYASFLAAMVPFAVAPLMTRVSRGGLAILATLLLALALGMTRGAYLGLIAGVIVLLLMTAWRTRAVRRVAIAGLAVGLLAPAGIGVYTVTMPHPGVALSPLSSGVSAPDDGDPGSPGGESESRSEAEAYPDTVQYRLERVPIAMDDLSESPIIGLGAASFGQRHDNPSRPGTPDHIAILAVAALYEAGILGAMALAVLFILVAVVMLRALRASAAPDDAAITAAYAASIATLLVAYQATNAIHFAVNWLLVGAALAWSVAVIRPQPPEPS